MLCCKQPEYSKPVSAIIPVSLLILTWLCIRTYTVSSPSTCVVMVTGLQMAVRLERQYAFPALGSKRRRTVKVRKTESRTILLLLYRVLATHHTHAFNGSTSNASFCSKSITSYRNQFSIRRKVCQ
jgi:hypothetical protein